MMASHFEILPFLKQVLINGHRVNQLDQFYFDGVHFSPIPYVHKESPEEVRALFTFGDYDSIKKLPSFLFAKWAKQYTERNFDNFVLKSSILVDLTKDPQPQLSAFERIAQSPEGVLKVKFLANNVEQIQALAEKTKCRFRFDPHFNISTTCARRILEVVPKERVEFFEEPFQTFEESQYFARESGVKLALDQKVEDFEFDILNKGNPFSYLVHKPANGQIPTWWNDRENIIISSAYSWGSCLLAEMLLAHQMAPEGVHGFSTYFAFGDQHSHINWGKDRFYVRANEVFPR